MKDLSLAAAQVAFPAEIDGVAAKYLLLRLPNPPISLRADFSNRT